MSLKAKLAQLSPEQREEATQLLGELKKRRSQRKFFSMYPDTGKYRRELYPKHMEFVGASAEHKETCIMAANRVGKTVVGSYACTAHLTGRYPKWWPGRVFNEPVNAWAAGDTAKTVRDIVQLELLGPPNSHGIGMIPGEDIIRCTPKAGTPDAVDTIYVKHYDKHGEQDGVSTCQLKSYDQGRIAFQGTEQHVIWLDEECPMDVYMECLIRTMTTNGIVYLTFTPLKGITDVVQLFQNYDD